MDSVPIFGNFIPKSAMVFNTETPNSHAAALFCVPVQFTIDLPFFSLAFF
jgi:hypothetical protein